MKDFAADGNIVVDLDHSLRNLVNSIRQNKENINAIHKWCGRQAKYMVVVKNMSRHVKIIHISLAQLLR